MLSVGIKAPGFVLESTQGIVDLNSIKEKVLLLFYPRDNTSGCTRQLAAAQDSLLKYQELGVSVLALNYGSLESHHRFSEKYGFSFPLCVDQDKQIAKLYGVVTAEGKLNRSAFIIDEHKIISYAKKGHPTTEELLEEINKIK